MDWVSSAPVRQVTSPAPCPCGVSPWLPPSFQAAPVGSRYSGASPEPAPSSWSLGVSLMTVVLPLGARTVAANV